VQLFLVKFWLGRTHESTFVGKIPEFNVDEIDGREQGFATVCAKDCGFHSQKY